MDTGLLDMLTSPDRQKHDRPDSTEYPDRVSKSVQYWASTTGPKLNPIRSVVRMLVRGKDVGPTWVIFFRGPVHFSNFSKKDKFNPVRIFMIFIITG